MKYKQLYHILDYVGEETDVVFAIRKGVNNSNMRYLPKLLFSSILFWLINTFSTWCIVNHEMDTLACVNS